MPPVDDMVEVYRCISEMEADRAMVEVLEPAGVEAYLRDRMSHALPAPDAETGGYFIAVSAEDADKARDVLREAIEDGALDHEEGEVLEGAAEEDEEEEDDDFEEESEEDE